MQRLHHREAVFVTIPAVCGDRLLHWTSACPPLSICGGTQATLKPSSPCGGRVVDMSARGRHVVGC